MEINNHTTVSMNIWTFFSRNIYVVLFSILLIASGILYLGQHGNIKIGQIFEFSKGVKRATIQGILINSLDNLPLRVSKIRLQHDIDNPYTTINEEGVFIIKDVEIPRNKIIGLVLHLHDGKILSKNGINLEADATYTKNTYSLGSVMIDLPTSESNVLKSYDDVDDERVKERQEKEIYFATVNLSSGNLNLRAYANTTSKIIKTIPKGATVKVLYNTYNLDEIRGIKGEWVRVEYDGEQGFVFDGYLMYLTKKPE